MPLNSRTAAIGCLMFVALGARATADYGDADPAFPSGEAVAPATRPDDAQYDAAATNPPPQNILRQPRPLRLTPVQQPTGGATRLASATEPAGAEQPRPLPLAQGGLPRGGFTRDAGPLATGIFSLAIVLGLFLLVAWALRRGMPRGTMLLPLEAVEVLGRAPLAGRQQVHLVRCGNKVLLVSVAPGNVETLTEITDPEEVERLVALCQRSGGSVGASFRQVFGQFAKQDRGTEYFHGRQLDDLDFSQLESLGHHSSRESVI